MIRLIVRAVIYLLSSAIGLLMADQLLEDVSVTASGFVITVVIFALAQTVLTPFVFKMVRRNADAFLGGVGIVSTLVALFIASLFGDALEIQGLAAWFLSAVIVWFVAALASFLLPFILVKAGIEHARENRAE